MDAAGRLTVGSKSFRSIHDFVRFGMNIHVACANGHCGHVGVVDAYQCHLWFRAYRWIEALDSSTVYKRFRCTCCGDQAGQLRPTENAVTVVDFFPADDRGWKRLAHRLRG